MTDGAPSTEDDRIVKLAHDLRTPLTIVTGFAELLQRRGDTLSNDDRAEYLARIVDGASEMRRILDSERADRRSG